ncbi:unnamed protein product [Orchesella dallaii]|uniref:Transmembrane protein n=1 Tax=Orchesella dallaii TaxID=48710 RepID=A0ABP1RGE8_9HEXA
MEGLRFLLTPSGLFRSLTVICGFPGVLLTWFAFFSSSWTNLFPEVKIIMELGKGFGVRIWKLEEQHFNSTSKSLENSEEEFDLVSDEDEQKWNKIVLETLIFEMLFISIVTIVLFISTIYLVIRIARKISTDSPCEVIFVSRNC